MVKKSVQIQSGKPASFEEKLRYSSSPSWGNADEDDEEDLNVFSSSDDEDDDDDLNGGRGSINRREREARAADRLSVRLLAIHDDDSDEEDRILRKSLRLLAPAYEEDEDEEDDEAASFSKQSARMRQKSLEQSIRFERESAEKRQRVIGTLVLWAIAGLSIVVAGLWYVGRLVVRPPSQPVGPYALVERQEGENFFPYYSFYEGPDSVGSNGYLNYVSRDHAERREILNVTYEYDDLDDLFHPPKRHTAATAAAVETLVATAQQHTPILLLPEARNLLCTWERLRPMRVPAIVFDWKDCDGSIAVCSCKVCCCCCCCLSDVRRCFYPSPLPLRSPTIIPTDSLKCCFCFVTMYSFTESTCDTCRPDVVSGPPFG